MAGVEGLEPPTYGFGDHNSNQLSHTPVLNYLFCLFMSRSFTLTWTKLYLLNTTGMLTLILLCRIITLFTRGTLKYYNFSWHFYTFSLYKKRKKCKNTSSSFIKSYLLRNNLRNNTRTNSTSTFTDSKT